MRRSLAAPTTSAPATSAKDRAGRRIHRHPSARWIRRPARSLALVAGALVVGAARLLRIAVPAVDGLVATRKERNLGGLAAAAAHGRVHHTRLASIIAVTAEASPGTGSYSGLSDLTTLWAA